LRQSTIDQGEESSMQSHTDMLSAFTRSRKHVWRLLLTILLVMAALPTRAVERWQMLPPTPAPIPSKHSGHISANGISIYYAMYGQGSPVILLHGGLVNSDWWGNQIPALATHHTVIVMDSRGHGRSTRDAQPYSYDLMADDVVALFDVLKLPKADVVGWSDGACIGIDLAIRHPDRVGRIVVFGGNTVTSAIKDDADKQPTNLSAVARAEKQYLTYSATPKEYQAFFNQITKMWVEQPNWTDAQLKTISAPVLVLDGDHDEFIKPEHLVYMATTIPGAGLMILPNTSHFAFLQDPGMFNYAILHFLGD
jgi:pimeloyl-ACP methyl ester carboxylesterase